MSAGRLDEMSCRELVQVITDYLEGTMRPDERARLDAHLEECPYCVTYVEQMRTTIAVLGELREDSLPAETRTQLVEAFRGWTARPAGGHQPSYRPHSR